ncbi:MAG: hypothetical protein GQE15_11010 [Archangiaceae bacterium]|nr:hypothetical protein [Archangiaceae bacterium]
MLPLVVSVLLAAPLPTVMSFTSDGTCSDERTIRDAITVRLGRDPFRDGTPGPRFIASITRQSPGWQSSLSVDGGTPRKRTSTDCRELAQSLALAIALVLEPVSPPKPPPAPEPVLEPEPEPVVFAASAAVFGSGGLSPAITAGVGLAAGLRADRFVLDVEARFDVPSATTLGSVTFRSFPLLLSIAPGVAAGRFRLSAPLSVGGLFVTGASSGNSLLVLGGLHAAVVIDVGNHWFFEPFLRAQASFIRVTVLSGTAPVWTTWPVTALAGIAMRHEFL